MKTIGIIVLFYLLSVSGSPYNNKCCNFNSYVSKNNSLYYCDNSGRNVSLRIQILTEQKNVVETGSLANSSSDQCVDLFFGRPVLFSHKNGKIVKEIELIDPDFFPKCCPIDYHYNPKTHGCIKKPSSTFFTSRDFVKVGLPGCKIIQDFYLEDLDVNITNGQVYLPQSNETFANGYCLDEMEGTSRYVIRVCSDIEICKNIRCVHKCCADGQSFIDGQNCRDTFEYGLDLKSTERIHNGQDPFAIIHNITFKVYLLNETRYYFYLEKNGNFMSYFNKTHLWKLTEVTEENYCMEHTHKARLDDGYYFFFKYPDPPLSIKFEVTRWVKCISCVFLTLTIAVYLILPEMRNLFGKTLLSYCCATLIFFTCLTYSQFKYIKIDSTCKTLGFINIYFSLASFTWLNVLCFDIWLTFGSSKMSIGNQRHAKELKRFIQYSAYGWGMPLLIVILTLIFHHTEILPHSIHPYIGHTKCFFEEIKNNYAELLFIIFPLLLMQVANLLMFVKTVQYCLKVKSEISRMNSSYPKFAKNQRFHEDKERLSLIIKLACIMGITYVFEIVSAIVSFDSTPVTRYIEVAWDTINCLQGVFIFFIFICKRKIYNAFRAKLDLDKSRKISVSSTATTQVSLQPFVKSSISKEKSPSPL